MSSPVIFDSPTAPDLGRAGAVIVAAAMALLSAIGAAASSAICLAILFELRPMMSGPYAQFQLIGDASRFSAEVSALLVFVISYRNARGRRIVPKRASLLGLMIGSAALGLLVSRFVVMLGPWLRV